MSIANAKNYLQRAKNSAHGLQQSDASRDVQDTLTRAIRRNNETSFWPYLTRRIASMTQQLAPAHGLRDISPGRNMQFIPYAAFAGASSRP